LEAQLALGRELTQKNQKDDSSDSEDEEMVTTVTTDNPWLDSANKGDELDEIFSGYRKFWEEKNEAEKKKEKLVKPPPKAPSVESEEESSENENESENEQEVTQSGWVEEDLSDNDENFIESLFDKAEEKAISKVDAKFLDLKPKLLESFENKKTKRDKKKKNPQHDRKYLEFAKEARLADIDQALNEGSGSEIEEEIRPSKRLLKEIEEIKEEKKAFMRGTSGEIDPHSFLSVKSKHLLTAIPKSQEFDDIDEDDLEDITKNNKLSLAEAFENDDIINDFIEETEEPKKDDVNEGLPGWGAWGGHNVKNKPKVEKQHNVKRKDRIIINNQPNEKLRKHLISSVPFPFTTVKDFEASMRLPVGKDFVPESAFRKLTAPSIITKAGTVIEPMTEDVLVQNNQNPQRKGKFFKKRNFKG
jgi:U3 small nucleolar RNA-associated protein 14